MVGATHNLADGILDDVLQGADLRIFLKPDAEVKTRYGSEPYIEALHLPHIIVRDGEFWAAQRNLLLTYNKKTSEVFRHYYAYYSGLDVFSVNSDLEVREGNARSRYTYKLMSSGRYAELGWKTAHRFEEVYDSDEPEEKARYIRAIEQVREFKALLYHREGHIQIHPIMYPFYYPERNAIDVQTELQFFPEFMRQNRDYLIEEVMRDQQFHLDYRDPESRELLVEGACRTFSSYFRILDNGVFQRVYDVGSGKSSRLARVRIFASIDP